MRVRRGRIGLVGMAAVLAGGGALGVAASSSEAGTGAARPAATVRSLGFVGGVSALVRQPIGARLVLEPYATYNVSSAALRALAARHPHITGSFRVRIVSVPRHGRSSMLLARRRILVGRPLIAAGARHVDGVPMPLGRIVLSRALTTKLKRAAARGTLRAVASASFSVTFTNRQGRTVTIAGKPWTFTGPLSLTAPRPTGAKLAIVSAALRNVISVLQRTPMACTTRNDLVRRLRLTDSVLLSGRRTGAAQLLNIWIDDARSMQADGLLRASQASRLRGMLGALLSRVGTGWPVKLARTPRWPRLPSCNGNAQSAVSLSQIFDPSDAKTIVVAIVSAIPEVGKVLGPLVSILWPSADPNNNITNMNNLIAKAQTERAFSDAKDHLGDPTQNSGLGGALNLVISESNHLSYFISAHTTFSTDKTLYQASGFQVTLLPLFVQFENMYLSLLREGVLSGLQWSASQRQVDDWEADLQQEIKSATAYVNTTYEAGVRLLGSSSDPYKNYLATSKIEGETVQRGAWLRQYQRQVLDYVPAWQYMDPKAYPYGNPGFRITSVAYSNPVGEPTDHNTFGVPQSWPMTMPLTHVTLGDRTWSMKYNTPCNGSPQHTETWSSSAIVGVSSVTGGVWTNAWGGGPTTSSTHTGDYDVGPTSTLGPIVGVTGRSLAINYTCSAPELTGMTLGFANGSSAGQGSGGTAYSYAPADEVLAGLKIMGHVYWGPSDQVADSVVFASRYADSYLTPGQLQAVGTPSAMCIDTTDLATYENNVPAVISACDRVSNVEPGHEVFGYDSSSGQLSFNSAYTAQTKCLEASGGAGTPVETSLCSVTPTAAQQWVLYSNGTILNPQSGLCMERAGAGYTAGTPVQLNACNGGIAQQWGTSWTTRQPGLLRSASNLGQCLNIGQVAVPPEQNGETTYYVADRADGAAVRLAACHPLTPSSAAPTTEFPEPPSWPQTWNYDFSSHELMVYGGSKCLAPAGAEVQVFNCGGANQQWTLIQNTDGTTTLQQGSLCLDAGTASSDLAARTCNGSVAQKWVWPVAGAAFDQAAVTIGGAEGFYFNNGVETIPFTVTVANGHPENRDTPTGTVTATASAGTVTPSPCTITGSGSTALCHLTLNPPSSARGTFDTVTVTYSGDDAHDPVTATRQIGVY